MILQTCGQQAQPACGQPPWSCSVEGTSGPILGCWHHSGLQQAAGTICLRRGVSCSGLSLQGAVLISQFSKELVGHWSPGSASPHGGGLGSVCSEPTLRLFRHLSSSSSVPDPLMCFAVSRHVWVHYPGTGLSGQQGRATPHFTDGVFEACPGQAAGKLWVPLTVLILVIYLPMAPKRAWLGSLQKLQLELRVPASLSTGP